MQGNLSMGLGVGTVPPADFTGGTSQASTLRHVCSQNTRHGVYNKTFADATELRKPSQTYQRFAPATRKFTFLFGYYEIETDGGE